MLKKIVYSCIFLTINLFSIEVVDGFDYPFGDRGYKDNKEIIIKEHITKLSKYENWKTDPCKRLNDNLEKNLIYRQFDKYKDCIYTNYERWNTVKPIGKDDWYNVNDVGDYVSGFGWLHPGEDWNLKNNGDLDSSIYSIAKGEVYQLISDGLDTETIIIKHKLPIEGFLYSIYTHVNVLSQITMNKKNENLKVGTKVNRGTKIAVIKNVTSFPDHLHFSIVYLRGNYKYLEYDRGNGYFSNFEKKYFNPMNKEKIQFAINLLKTSGYLDPSDFIEEHRPSSKNNTKDGYQRTLNNHLSTNQSDFTYFDFAKVTDYTLKDDTVVKNNQKIIKIWKLKNIGIDIWDENYYLRYIGNEKGKYFDELRSRKWHINRKVFPNTDGLLCADLITDSSINGKKLYFKLFNGKNQEIQRVNGKSNSFYFQVKVQGEDENEHISYLRHQDLLYPKLTKDEAKNLIMNIFNIDISNANYYKNLDENKILSKYIASELLFQVARQKNKNFVDDIVSHVRIEESGITFKKSILGKIFYARNTKEIQRTTKLTNSSSYIYAQKFVLGSVLFPIKHKDDTLYWSKEMRYIDFKNAVKKLEERIR